MKNEELLKDVKQIELTPEQIKQIEDNANVMFLNCINNSLSYDEFITELSKNFTDVHYGVPNEKNDGFYKIDLKPLGLTIYKRFDSKSVKKMILTNQIKKLEE